MIDAFEINSIGDGLFVERVLTGLAMLHESGTIAGLAAIGLLLGLFVAVTKGVMTAGRDVDFKYPLIAFCLYSVLFGVTVPVIIVDKVTAPGQTTLEVRGPIDNVPIGAAMAGYLISGIGYSIADRFEDAFSVPGSARVTEGGWGRTLETLAAAREIGAGKFMGTDGFPEFRDSNLRYISDCTMSGMQLDPTQAQKMQADPDPWKGIEYASKFLTTETRLNVDGSPRLPPDMPEMVSCAEAMIRLQNGAGTIKPSFAAYIKGRYGGEVQDSAMEGALKSIGVPASVDAQKYMEASMQAALMAEAVLKGHITSGQTSATLMIQQASEQRRTQWAAEETMLKRVLQPTIGFFEAMLYAVVPFAVFAIGLGPFGLNLATKYMILALWVQLFMPILAVVNLFQLTAMEHFVNAQMMGDGNNPLTSIHGSWAMQEKALDWLSFGATIAAATPSLALFLLFGGAVAATAMAGRLQGGDHVDEKQLSPDALKVGPVQDVAGLNKFDQVSGNRNVGSDGILTSYSYSDTLASQASSQLQEVQSSQIAATDKLSNAFSEIASRGANAGKALSNSLSEEYRKSSGASFTFSDGTSVSYDDVIALGRKDSTDLALSGGVNLQGGARANQPFNEGQHPGSAPVAGTGKDAKAAKAAQAAAKHAKSLSNVGKMIPGAASVIANVASMLDAGGVVRSATTDDASMSEAAKKLDGMSAEDARRFERFIGSTTNNLLQRTAAATSALGVSAGMSDEVSRAISDTTSEMNAFSTIDSYAQSHGSNQTMDLAQIARFMEREYGSDPSTLHREVASLVGDRAINENYNEYQVGHLSGAQRQYAAMWLSLRGEGDGADHLLEKVEGNQDLGDQRRVMLSRLSGEIWSTPAVNSLDYSKAYENQGVADSVAGSAGRATTRAATINGPSSAAYSAYEDAKAETSQVNASMAVPNGDGSTVRQMFDGGVAELSGESLPYRSLVATEGQNYFRQVGEAIAQREPGALAAWTAGQTGIRNSPELEVSNSGALNAVLSPLGTIMPAIGAGPESDLMFDRAVPVASEAIGQYYQDIDPEKQALMAQVMAAGGLGPLASADRVAVLEAKLEALPDADRERLTRAVTGGASISDAAWLREPLHGF